MSRFLKRARARNSDRMYKDILDKRNKRSVVQYRTPAFKEITEEDKLSVESYRHLWAQGDTFWRLSSSVYGHPRYWYIIASFNNKPTESHVKIGEIIRIPLSLLEALEVIE